MRRLFSLLMPYICVLATTWTFSSSKSAPDGDCTPKNWKHTWTRVGPVWYTLVKGPGSWKAVQEDCKNIETGRTALATIRNVREKNHILAADFPDGQLWTGGVRLADDLWFWYRENSKGKTLTDIAPTFWADGKPTRLSGKRSSDGVGSCIAVFNFVGNGTWLNAPCEEEKSALCELRC